MPPRQRHSQYPDEETRIVKEVKDLNSRMVVIYEKLEGIEKILTDFTCQRINRSKEEDRKPEEKPKEKPSEEAISSWFWT